MKFVFDSLFAFQQMGLFFMAFIFTGIGGLLFIYPIWKYLSGVKVAGRIVGVKATGYRANDFDKEENAELQIEETKEEEKSWENFLKEVKKDKKSGCAAVFAAFMMIGIPTIFIAIGFYFAADFVVIKTTGEATIGKVTRIERGRNSNGGTTYTPYVKYQDWLNRNYEEKSTFSSSSSWYKIGERVKIVYARNNPKIFYFDNLWTGIGFPMSFSFSGGVVLWLIFNANKWQKKADKVNKSYAIKYKTNEMYYSIYEYIAPDGQVYTSEDSGGSNSIYSRLPDKELTLILDRDDYSKAAPPSFGMAIFGLIFLAPGLFIFNEAITGLKINFATIFMAIAFVVWIGFKIASKIKFKDFSETKEKFKARMKESRSKSGKVLSNIEILERIEAANDLFRKWVPLYLFLVFGLMAGGVYWLNNQLEFQKSAISTVGEVVDIRSRRSSDSTTYYPLVQFRAQNGEPIKFADNLSSSTPSYSRGDVVKVLYNPNNYYDAMIDRGMWNTLPAAAIVLIGLWILLKLVKRWRAVS